MRKRIEPVGIPRIHAGEDVKRQYLPVHPPPVVTIVFRREHNSEIEAGRQVGAGLFVSNFNKPSFVAYAFIDLHRVRPMQRM
jgi:hypothetical protein